MLPFLNIEEGSFYYSLFYRLSFIVAFLLFLYAGYRRRYALGALGLAQRWLKFKGSVLDLFAISLYRRRPQ